MAGWDDVGQLIAGNSASNELSYQKGLALGANTQNAMQQARERVRVNTALEKLGTDPSMAEQLGLTPAALTLLQAGVNPDQASSAALHDQERKFRTSIADPTVDLGVANRQALALSNKPTGAFDPVGSKGYQNIFHPEQGVMPLPGGAASGGGDAAAIQILQAFGFLDANGHVIPGKERQAFDVMRTTGKTVDEGGVPGTIDFNPFAASSPTHGPGASPTDMTSLLPPAPAAANMPPAASPVAGTGVVSPASSAARVAANAAEIERAKEMGTAAGKNAAQLPDTNADIDQMEASINQLLSSPGFENAYGHIQGQPIMSTLTGLVDQDAMNSQAMLKNLNAQTFGLAIKKMVGLGQLSNAEGMKVTDAFTLASNPLIDPQIARAAWGSVQQRLAQARTRADVKANNVPGAGAAAPAAGAPEVKMIGTRKFVKVNGQWFEDDGT